MALNVGSTQIGSIYLGSTLIAEAYYGSTKVYQYTPPNYNQLSSQTDITQTRSTTADQPQQLA